MKYLSTRGNAPLLSFSDVALSGTARDGGLYVPESFPQFSRSDLKAMARLSYPALAFEILKPYVAGSIPDADLKTLLDDTYGAFHHPAVAPLQQVDTNIFLLELFHGETLAFKDYALQFLGRLFDYLLAKSRRHITVIGATSGDTGSAAIAACAGKSTMDIFVLHPQGRTSAVQRRQMTTVTAANVHNIAVEGSFDDCQDIVKALFADAKLVDELHLTAVNSINWARILAQVVYYFYAALRLGAPERAVSFVIPTGNFGNIYAGYVARQMGLPIQRLVAATNRNDILARFFESGAMEIRPVEPSLSPSMDIQISSNFERLLFEVYKRDGARTGSVLKSFRTDGSFAIGKAELTELQQLFRSVRVDDAATLSSIRDTYQHSGVLVDPHTAVGLAAARQLEGDTPIMSFACAHPAKFPDSVRDATGVTPPVPARLQAALDGTERFVVLENSVSKVRNHIRSQLQQAAA